MPGLGVIEAQGLKGQDPELEDTSSSVPTACYNFDETWEENLLSNPNGFMSCNVTSSPFMH